MVDRFGKGGVIAIRVEDHFIRRLHRFHRFLESSEVEFESA